MKGGLCCVVVVVLRERKEVEARWRRMVRFDVGEDDFGGC